MKAEKIAELLKARPISAINGLDKDYKYVSSSDLMSDCLAMITNNQSETIMLTGLCNIQSLRTAEMLDIQMVVITRGKSFDEEILSKINEFNIDIYVTDYTSFEASGILYANGLKAINRGKKL